MSEELPPVVIITEPAAPPPAESGWAKLWAWVRRYVIQPVPLLVMAIVGIVLVLLGSKKSSLGGLAGKLAGQPEGKDLKTANSVPEDRVDDKGKPIPIGTPDSKGLTQAEVVAIEQPGIFDDKDKVKITPPGEDKPIEVQLPDGVEAKQVETVTVVKPEVKTTKVENSSQVAAKKVTDLVNKYGK